MKCTVCREPAVIDLKRHNANFCADHLTNFCRQQVAKAIAELDMFESDDHVLIAVSGGKDSLALWDILDKLGYRTTGVYLGLGIGEYSSESQQFVQRFASDHSLDLRVVDINESFGFTIPDGAAAAKRVPCSACGLTKRHVLDSMVSEIGADVLATGHNLDDEAAVLLGNVLHWQTEYLGRQHPVLPARNALPRKVKPLVRLSEREMAAYCVVNGIDYVIDECPLAAGNKHLTYKAALNTVEAVSPGTKGAFFFSFLRNAHDRFAPAIDEPVELTSCGRCGSATTGEVCAFCRLVDRATQPVALTRKRTS